MRVTKKQLAEDLAAISSMIGGHAWGKVAQFVANHPHVLAHRATRAAGNSMYIGEPFLLLAASYGTPEAVKAMIAAGASLEERGQISDPNAMNAPFHRGRTALAGALARSSKGRDQIIDALDAAGARWDVLDANGLSVVFASLGDMDPGLLEQAIARGAPLEGTHRQCGLPAISWLMIYCGSAYPDARRLASLHRILDAGAPVNQRAARIEHFPLCLALTMPEPGLWEKVSARAAPLDSADQFGRNVLHTPIATQAVAWVMERAPHLLDARAQDGQTPVHRAVASKEWDHALALIMAGANLHVLDIAGAAGVTPAQMIASEKPPSSFVAAYRSILAARVASDVVRDFAPGAP